MPRFRYDQLMSFGWKVLIPIATLNLIITAYFTLVVNMKRKSYWKVLSMLRGLLIVMKYAFKKPVTIRYPEQKRKLPAVLEDGIT